MDLRYGMALQNARLAAGLSQEIAAERLGVSVSSIGAYERGITPPAAELLVRMARMYRCRELLLEYLARDPVFRELSGEVRGAPRPEAVLGYLGELQDDTAMSRSILDYGRTGRAAEGLRQELQESVRAGMAVLATM